MPAISAPLTRVFDALTSFHSLFMYLPKQSRDCVDMGNTVDGAAALGFLTDSPQPVFESRPQIFVELLKVECSVERSLEWSLWEWRALRSFVS